MKYNEQINTLRYTYIYIHKYIYSEMIVVIVQQLNRVQFFGTPWTAACQASLCSTISQNLLKFMCIELLMLSNHLILCYHLFNVSQNQGLFQWVSCLHQEAKVSKLSSASFLPVNIQSWFPLRLTGLISLQFKGFSIVFSGTNNLKKHHLFGA